jgi:hypothetical protein
VFKVVLVVCATVLIALPSRAAFIEVYSTPPFEPGVGGYKGASLASDSLNNAGTAASLTTKYDASGNSLGGRVLRWNPSGFAELGTVADAVSYGVRAINEAGTVVGVVTKGNSPSGFPIGTRALRWDGSGTTATELGHLGLYNTSSFTNAAANAINDAGTAVGYAEKHVQPGTVYGERAVRWDAGSTVAVELGVLGTNFNSTRAAAYAINATGTIVGEVEKYESNTNKGYRAVRWNAGSTVATELGHIGTSSSGVTNAYARAINSAGTAVGYAEKYDASHNWKGTYAVRWDADGTDATELGSFTSLAINYAYAVNDAGTAVGYTDYRGQIAARWDGSGTAVTGLGDIGTFTNTSSRANDINSGGIIVGTVRGRGVYWDLDGDAVDLNTLIDPNAGWFLTSANAITDSGWIGGTAQYDPDGPGGQAAYGRPFVMQVPAAVPEPSALALTVPAAAAWLRRQRRGTCCLAAAEA